MTALRKKQEIEGKLAPDKVELQQKTMRNLVMIEKDLTEQKNELEQLRQQLGEDVSLNHRVSAGLSLTHQLSSLQPGQRLHLQRLLFPSHFLSLLRV